MEEFEMPKTRKHAADADADLPGTRPGSTIRDIYYDLMDGKVLSSLDAVWANRTICLTKYISILRTKYGIDIRDKWIKLENKKEVKLYWIE